MAREKISVLIVDDSALMRNVVGKIIASTEDMVVAAKAFNGAHALEKLQTVTPDVIILDLEMPEVNGIDFLEERLKRRIEIPVVILSSVARRGAQITMQALALGASDFIPKPSGTDANELHRVEHQLVSTVRAYALRYRRTRTRVPRPRIEKKAPTTKRIEQYPQIKAIAIGISTGGPNALRRVFQELDASLPAPVFVVQHMPKGFTGEFAESLNRLSALEVKEAEAGDIASPGRAFVAPGDRHMIVTKRRLADIIELEDSPPMNGHRPSVDMLFSSVAKVYGENSLAVIMTGMGRDGAGAIGEIKAAGGVTIGQDEESSVVYGMPRVAAERGYLDMVVPLRSIAELVNRIALK